jgi:glutaredoxin
VAIALALSFWLLPGPCCANPESAATTTASEPVVIELFTRSGCPRCAAAKAFLSTLSGERPGLQVLERSVDTEPTARRELEQHWRDAGLSAAGVPTFVVRGQVVVGFEDAQTTGEHIKRIVAAKPLGGAGSEAATPAGTCGIDEKQTDCGESATVDEVDTKVLGPLSVSRLGLPLFTLALGLLDGFNPCAMWVLLFLLAMLAGQRDRTRLAITGGTFVIASGVVYYAFMAAWLNLFLIVGVSRMVQLALGAIALAIGAFNVKDFAAFQRGPSLSIPASVKPGIYARVRRVLRADTLAASMLGVAVLAVLVNCVELLCTAGFPALYTSVLARQQLSAWTRAAYLGLYNLAYVADDALVVTIAVVTLSRRRLSETAGRWLKLASGVVMLALGLALLLVPDWLT